MKELLNTLSNEELIALKEWLSQEQKNISGIISKKLQQLVVESEIDKSTLDVIDEEISARKLKNTGNFKYLEEVKKIKDKIETRDITLENLTFRSSVWKDVENIDPNLPGYLITPAGDCIPVVEGISHIKAMKNILSKYNSSKYEKVTRFDLILLAFLETGSILYVGVRRKGPLDSLELYRNSDVYLHMPYKNGINLPVTVEQAVINCLKKNNNHNFKFHDSYIDETYDNQIQNQSSRHY